MINTLLGHQALLNLCMLNALLALSQYVVLRAGVFSLASAAIAAVGAYTAGGLMLKAQWHPLPAIAAAAVLGTVVALVLAIPLARLRGVFQAIATLAFVQIVMSVVLYAEGLTGGATGLNGIAQSVSTPQLLLALGVVCFLLVRLGRSTTGRAFDTIRQDETVAVSLGIDVASEHRLAFALSGAIAGLAGGLMAGHNYSVAHGEFGFHMMIALLSFVVLGGRTSVAGPLAGAVILTLLPEIARPLADNRMVIYGALLILGIVYLPDGVVDSGRRLMRRRAEGAREPRRGLDADPPGPESTTAAPAVGAAARVEGKS